MIAWAGRLIVIFGAAHTILALTLMRAARYAGDWFRGALWHDDLAAMSAANSALWLSLDSFGVPLVLVGMTVLWLDRRGITPPPVHRVDARTVDSLRRGSPAAHTVADHGGRNWLADRGQPTSRPGSGHRRSRVIAVAKGFGGKSSNPLEIARTPSSRWR
ncbi:hypothetical protein [Nocardia nepalensis]|uniref:hypothetical protein n=1 Tax=Nocardia nepalensis TaxID=3375448 RepID=UPI003B66B556